MEENLLNHFPKIDFLDEITKEQKKFALCYVIEEKSHRNKIIIEVLNDIFRRSDENIYVGYDIDEEEPSEEEIEECKSMYPIT